MADDLQPQPLTFSSLPTGGVPLAPEPQSPDAPVVPPPPPAQEPMTPPAGGPVAPPKTSGGKTNAIIGGLFLLIVLPVVGYYVAQKTNIMNNLPFATNYPDGRALNGQLIGGQNVTFVATNGAAFTDGRGMGGNPGAHANTVTSCPSGQKMICGIANKASDDAERFCYCEGPTGTVTPTTTPTPTISPTPTITGTPTPTTPPPTNPPSSPGRCDASCDNDSGCQSGLVCASVEGVRRCRNAQCTTQFSCVCPVGPTATPTQSGPIAAAGSPTPTPVPKTPVAGIPSVLGAATVAGGFLLLLLGLAL